MKFFNLCACWFLTSLMLFSLNLKAQLYEISGEISTETKGNLPEDLSVILLETQQQGEIGKDAKYKFKNVNPGEYHLVTYAFGYESLSKKVTVTQANVRLNIELKALQKELDPLIVQAPKPNEFGIHKLNTVVGTSIYAGKKSELIVMEDVSGNFATNNSRQIYAKVPGLNIWESDGAGVQLGIGGRGLNPSRTSNFNTRQNGYDISADALGYPESYYSPPAEAIEEIEIVRGAASLQYGTQFGGMVNFNLKGPPKNKSFELVNRQSLGSFGLYNSFISLGGRKKKWSYYTFYQYKTADGWRPNAGFDMHMAHAAIQFNASKKISLKAEYTFMDYLAQQPGGLTDALFNSNPRQSIRKRNWFKVNWNLMAIDFTYVINERNRINSRSFALVAGRDALGFLGQISRADPNEERDLIRDLYGNFGNETRYMRRYELVKGQSSAFLIGFRYYRGLTEGKQGLANNDQDADFHYLNKDESLRSSYDFPSENKAVFIENMFQLSSRLTITPGIRAEYIRTRAEGFYNIQNRNRTDSIIFSQRIVEDRENERAFLLAGIGLSYKINDLIETYANCSQNYRSINFNDMRIVNPNFRVDPDLQDEKGYSADLGIRGNKYNLFYFDVSLFYLRYNNRIGEMLQIDEQLFTAYRYRTNISDSRTVGLETMVEININSAMGWKQKNTFSIFSNISIMDAIYMNSEQEAFESKKVELVPPLLIKTGMGWKRKAFKSSFQCSYTASHFTDATNAEFTSNAVNGLIPSYFVLDWSFSYSFKQWALFTGINNMGNTYYFTRRASGYPGPGILPADGRNAYLTLQFKL